MVSGKLVHLGDQLERKNLPRKRIEEARDLILEFYKFWGFGGGIVTNVVGAQSNETQLLEAATRFKSLSSLCLELPDDERFLNAKQRVTVSCQHLDTALLERFRANFLSGNIETMKSIADVLLLPKNYSQCAEIMVEETIKTIDPNKIHFKDITKCLVSSEKLIMTIFLRPDSVLMQLMHSLFTTKLKVYLNNHIKDELNSQAFLTNLYNEYRNIEKLVVELSNELTLITDPMQLSKLFRELFAPYLVDYMKRESDWLTERLTGHLEHYYQSQKHQKRPLNVSGLAELRRDIQAKFHITGGDRSQSDYEVSLLSEEVAVNIIEDVRRAAKRCLLLSQPSAIPENGKFIFNCLYHYLVVEHVDYGVTLALQGLNIADPRSSNPNLVFFLIIHEATSIFHFFEKTIDESILPMVMSNSSYANEISSKRKELRQDLEIKFCTGLEKCLNLAISRVQYLLSNEQRKTDFRPDTNANSGLITSNPPSLACQHVVGFLTHLNRETHQHLDGQNLKTFLHEFGMKLNRTLVDHFYNFSFSDTGGFVAMQDVTAYREIAKHFESPTVNLVFDILLKLMNLMLIKPENVQQVVQDYLQSGIPKDLLMNFIQLRTDYKTAKLQNVIQLKSTR
ncbi:Exocyst complex component 5 [Schistosoma japonicum]|uniref:Exocyst complex component 5 n=1 Tax=Schistosoma japonicum TaxID=6182 RepID=A0A4Z2CZD2_SCHJA|nr:Exocyst complex component 5 [Schistosoma japonicum]